MLNSGRFCHEPPHVCVDNLRRARHLGVSHGVFYLAIEEKREQDWKPRIRSERYAGLGPGAGERRSLNRAERILSTGQEEFRGRSAPRLSA
jgi:hypothetical protein